MMLPSRWLLAAHCDRCDAAITFETTQPSTPHPLLCPLCIQHQLDGWRLSTALRIGFIVRRVERGAADPEAAASTLEMLEALLADLSQAG